MGSSNYNFSDQIFNQNDEDSLRSFGDAEIADLTTQYIEARRNLHKEDHAENSQIYVEPMIEIREPKQRTRKNLDLSHIRTEIPKRLDAPLIPYPKGLVDFVHTGDLSFMCDIQGSHYATVNYIREKSTEIYKRLYSDRPVFEAGINNVKKYSTYEYSLRAVPQHNSAYENARKSSEIDLNLLSETESNKFYCRATAEPTISFMFLIQRIRPLLLRDSDQLATSKYEASIEKLDHSAKLVYCSNDRYSYFLIMFGSHFAIYHSSSKKILIGPSTNLDYIYAISDVLNNTNIITSQPEYHRFKDILKILGKLILKDSNHNDYVKFFKRYETFCLYMADIRTHTLVNWGPINDTFKVMVELSNKLSEDSITEELVLYYIASPNPVWKEKSMLCDIIRALRNLSNYELLEASSLHKFLFYAEVSSEKGIRKFLKRVHTPRIVDKDNEEQLVNLTKREFLLNFTKKEGVLPRIKSPVEKILILNNLLKQKSLESLESFGLAWWSDIIFGKTLTTLDSGHAVEFAKDKGAIIYDITYGPRDTMGELLQVMVTEDYKDDDFIHDINTGHVKQEVYRTYTEEHPEYVRLPVRLCEKEKEQGEEARCFGVATAPMKHRMSKYMNKAKLFLSYLDEQSMTISDAKRKSIHHEMAQNLSSEDTYAVMMDIEGHNQSMQPENYSKLLQFIGTLFGEEDWWKLAHFFKNLTVYHYDYFSEIVTVSKGQLGGIEGWMNPVWTAVTLQQVKLIRYNTELSIPDVACYSDDVVLNIVLPSQTPDSIDKVLTIISKEMFKLGFTVKPSQSAVSKYRITLLRQHSLKGIRADATLKRLMSMSTANNQRICSDEIEISAISSVSSSAMSTSYHIRTCTFLKWYKAYFLTGYLISSIFSERRENSLISPDKIDPKLASIFYNTQGITVEESSLMKSHIEKAISIELSRTRNRFGERWGDDYFKKWIEMIENTSIENIKRVNISDAVLFLSLENDFLQSLWRILLTMPVAVGGCGLEFAINQALTGNSDSFFKIIYYNHRMVKLYYKDTRYFFEIIEKSLKQTKRDDLDINPSRMIQSKWLPNQKITSVVTSVNKKLVNTMKRLTKNTKLLEVVSFSDSDKRLSNNIYSIFKNNFNHRVASFFYENSMVSIVQFLVRKLETGTSLINKIRKVSDFKKSLTTRSRESIISMLSCEGELFGRITKDTDILTYLKTRRRILAPDTVFTDIEEPLYDHMLEESPNLTSLFTVVPGSPMSYRDGRLSFKEGLFEGETLYKGDIKDEEVILSTREEMLISKLVCVTKWSVLKTYDDLNQSTEIEELDFIQACNQSLSTLTSYKFKDLSEYTPTNLGGEILHRIPNQGFQSKISTKVLPNDTQYINCYINQSSVLERELEDSNINFELIRIRLILMYAYLHRYDNTMPTYHPFRLRTLENVAIVQTYGPRLTKIIDELKLDYKLDRKNERINFKRINLSATAYLYSEDLVHALASSDSQEEENLISAIEKRDDIIILDFYKSLNREYLMVDMEIVSKNTWRPIMNQLKIINKDCKDLSDDELIEAIKHKLSILLYDIHHSPSYSNYRKKFEDKLSGFKMNSTNLSKEYVSLGRIIRLANSDKTNSDKFSIPNDAVEMIISKFKTISIDIIKDLCLGYGLILSVIKGDITIDVKNTIKNVRSIISLCHADEIMPKQIKIMIIFCDVSRVLRFFDINSKMITKFLKNVAKISKEKYIMPESVSIKIEKTIISYDMDKIPIDISNINYTSYSLPVYSLRETNIWNNTLKTCKKISELYGHPYSLYSKTGSDSLTAQYGLLHLLKTSGVINEEDDISFLSSGRGDGKIASDILNLKTNHFSKPTTFTKMSVLEGINTDFDFDLTIPSTINFHIPGDVVIIDISFITGDQTGLLDTVLNLLSEEKEVILRINSIKEFTENFCSELIKLNISIDYIFPTSDRILPYHQYFRFYRSGHIVEQSYEPLEESFAFKVMISHYIKHINYWNLTTVSDEIVDNSIVSLIDSDKSLTDLIRGLATASYQHHKINAIQSIMRNGNLGNIIEIDEKSLSHFSKNISDTDTIYFEQTGPELYKNVTEVDCGSSRQKGYKYWSKNVTEVSSKELTTLFLCIDNMSEENLISLARSHPLQKVRTYLKNYQLFKSENIDISRASIEDLSDIHREISLDNPSVDSSLSNNVRFCLGLLVLSVIYDDYAYGLKILFTGFQDKSKNKNIIEKRLAIYRKMSPLYNKLKNNMSMDDIAMKDINLLHKHLEQPAHNLKKKKREMYNEGMDKESIESLRASLIGGISKFIEGLSTGDIPIIPSEMNTGLVKNINDIGSTLNNITTESIYNIVDGNPDEDNSEDVLFDPGEFIQSGLEAILSNSNKLIQALNQWGELDDNPYDYLEPIDEYALEEEFLRDRELEDHDDYDDPGEFG